LVHICLGGGICGRGGGGEKGGGEGFLEVVDFTEVVEGVGVLLAEDTLFDEEKDDFSNVAAFGEAPILEDGGGHRTVFLEGVVTEAGDQF